MRVPLCIGGLSFAMCLSSGAALAQPVLGSIGGVKGPNWCAAYIDLQEVQSFSRGDALCVRVLGPIRVLVRLKPAGVPPSSPAGIEGSVTTVQDGAVELVLSQDHHNIDQISVHSCAVAWDLPVDPDAGEVILNGVSHGEC